MEMSSAGDGVPTERVQRQYLSYLLFFHTLVIFISVCWNTTELSAN